MDWLTFFSQTAAAVAWPSAVVAIVLLLRTEIKTLLLLLKKLKAGPIEAEFEQEVKELRTETDIESPQPPQPVVSPERQKLLQLAQISPRSAILEAWQSIETEAQRLASIYGESSSPREFYSPSGVARVLSRFRALSPEELALFHDLRSLRNQAAHAPDFNPTLESVLNYIELASRVKASIARHLDNEHA